MKSSRYLITTALLGNDHAETCNARREKVSTEIPLNDGKQTTVNWFDSIKSFDGIETLSKDRLNYGYRLFEEYQVNHDIQLLKSACDNGDYEALQNYAFHLLDTLSDETLTSQQRDEYTSELYEYLDRASQLYWSAGFLLASRILHELSENYRKIKLPEGVDNLALANQIEDESLVCFLEAKMLIGIPYSADIIATLQNEEEFSRAKWNEAISSDEERINQRDDLEDLLERSLGEIKPLLRK